MQMPAPCFHQGILQSLPDTEFPVRLPSPTRALPEPGIRLPPSMRQNQDPPFPSPASPQVRSTAILFTEY